MTDDLSCARCGQPAPKPRAREKSLCRPCHKLVVGWCRRGAWAEAARAREMYATTEPTTLDESYEDMRPDEEAPAGWAHYDPLRDECP